MAAKNDHSSKESGLTTQRRVLYAKMTPAARHLADYCNLMMARGAKGVAKLSYDVGAEIMKALAVKNSDSIYGPDLVKQLSLYLGLDPKGYYLYSLRDLASAIQKDLILQWSRRPMSNGRYLTEEHWLLLARVSSPKEQIRLLEQACQLSLGPKAFVELIKAATLGSGITPRSTRRPAVPTSEVAAMLRYCKLASALIKYGDADKQLWTDLETLPADAINEMVMERLKKTQAQVDQLREQLDAAKPHLDASVARAVAIMKEPKQAKGVES